MTRPVGLSLLIVAATALFVVGISVEKGDSHPETGAETASHVESGAESTEGEGSDTTQLSEGDQGGGEEKVLGIDIESTPLVVLAVLVSLGLAVAVLLLPEAGAVLLLVALVMAAFTVVDIAEVLRQLDESNCGVALIAGAVAALHACAALALATWSRRDRGAADTMAA